MDHRAHDLKPEAGGGGGTRARGLGGWPKAPARQPTVVLAVVLLIVLHHSALLMVICTRSLYTQPINHGLNLHRMIHRKLDYITLQCPHTSMS